MDELENADIQPSEDHVVEAKLTATEARVIGALVEKSITTPKYYPMTVNALKQACNQKNSRFPVMNLTEGEVGAALNHMADRNLVRRDDSSARATKWTQRFGFEFKLPAELAAILVASMLRGPQTRSELRMHSEPLGGPKDHASAESDIDSLINRAEPLLVEFPKQPGQKEARLMHTLCGQPEMPAVMPAEARASARAVGAEQLQALVERIAALEARVAELEAG